MNSVLAKAKRAAQQSGLSYREIGMRMGYPHSSARQSVDNFLRSKNPTVAMLIRFAKAIGIEARDLL